MKPVYLVIPDTRRAHGTGHIRRAWHICAEIGDSACVCPDFPWQGDLRSPEASRSLIEPGHHVRELPWEHARLSEPVCIVLDAQTATKHEILSLASIAPVVGVDLGGEGRAYASYLLDTLPNLEAHKPNAYRPDALPLPARVRDDAPGPNPRILVSIGGDDTAGLTEPLADAMDSSGAVGPSAVDIVLPAAAVQGNPSRAQRLEQLPIVHRVFATNALREVLGDYDIVCCSFGLTAFEAMAAGCTVITVPPTPYHAALARAVALPVLDPVSAGGIADLLHRTQELWERQESVRPEQRTTLGAVITALDMNGCVGEPSGGPARTPVAVRLPDRSFRPEEQSGLLYLERFQPLTIQYNENYFDEAYESQYGRTYLDDFDHIRSMGLARLRQIRTLRRERSGTLLDVGCAYGPFLSAAQAEGYRCIGTDVFPGAVSYVSRTLGITAFVGSATELSRESHPGLRNGADVVTMWYVIEHIDELDLLFDRIHSVLKPGGVFAFATPNGNGISARRDLECFLTRSPEDHRTVWTPTSARRYLRARGFTSVRVRVTGHHPERISPKWSRNPLVSWFLRGYSRLFGLGDTVEVYARRQRKRDEAER